uniref:Uncharacterized protein n=1 Tax=Setaria italica TaxID=4555 RepID=K4A3K8_SETIT
MYCDASVAGCSAAISATMVDPLFYFWFFSNGSNFPRTFNLEFTW